MPDAALPLNLFYFPPQHLNHNTMASLFEFEAVVTSRSESVVCRLTSPTRLATASRSFKRSQHRDTEIDKQKGADFTDGTSVCQMLCSSDANTVNRRLSFINQDDRMSRQCCEKYDQLSPAPSVPGPSQDSAECQTTECAQSPQSLSLPTDGPETPSSTQSALHPLTSFPANPENTPQSPPLSPLQLIEAEEITEEKILGTGGFVSVHLAVYNDRKVVRKTFHTHFDEKVAIETYSRELKALELELNHVNVVEMLGASSPTGWQAGAFIVMSYAGNVTVDSYLPDLKNDMTIQHLLFFCGDIMEGLKYLHSKKVVHLDIKPANCIFSPEEQNVRLCDFGAMHIVGEPWKSQIEGTLSFRAPELFFCKGSATPDPSYSCDIYSLAVTMWSLDSRSFPFHGMVREAVIYGVVQNNLRPHVPEHNPPENSSLLQQYRDLYTRCWSANPDDRPSLEQAIGIIDNIADQL